jgi:FkbM family methyltransferase
VLPHEVRAPARPAVRPLRTQARSRALRLGTRVPSPRLQAWRAARRGPGAAVLDLLDAAVRTGPVRIAGGPAVGLLVPSALLRIDHAQAGLLVRGAVEPPVAEALRRHLPVGGVLWDVGANIGYFAALGGRIVGPEGQVLALDPVPEHASSVAAIAALNAMPWVRSLQAAAWREAGEVELVLPGDGAWAHLAQTVAGRAEGRRIAAAALRLDDLLDDPAVRIPDVVKIDVEGAELGVLDGLERTVAAHRPVLVVETHDTADGVVAWAATHGYRVENLERPTPIGGPGGQLAALLPGPR